jgi:hypothetical protein
MRPPEPDPSVCSVCTQPLFDVAVDLHGECCTASTCGFRRVPWSEFLAQFDQYAAKCFSLLFAGDGSSWRARRSEAALRAALLRSARAGTAERLPQVIRALGRILSTRNH